jgi:hypothetical protein
MIDVLEAQLNIMELFHLIAANDASKFRAFCDDLNFSRSSLNYGEANEVKYVQATKLKLIFTN